MTRPIDIDHLEKYVAGDDALRDEILTIFQERVETLRAQVDVTAEDELWHDTMHAMKGAARGVGAWAVGDLCERAEAYISDFENKHTAREQLVAELDIKLDEMLQDARNLRDGV